MSSKNKNLIASVLLAIVVAGGIFYVGFQTGFNQKTAVSPVPIATSTLLNANFSAFWETVKAIKEKYYGIKDVTDQDILYGAANGAMESLKDPYSTFFTPKDSQKFSEDLNGGFGGVGMEIGIKKNQITVIAPLKGNPAEKIGLKAGDQILKIGDTLTADMDIDSAVKLIRGEPGTDVRLLIMRETWKEPKEFKITRASVQVPTLDWEMKDGKIAYIQLYNFNANASSLFYNAALSALIQGVNGIVLDLRNDPGGYLDVAVQIAGWFVQRGEIIVKEDFRSGEQNIMRSAGPSALENIPVVVLVNGGSASAAEILAGALQDVRNVKLVGEKTFGKGSVQEIQSFSDGSSAKISVAEWLTPKGRHINKKGIDPDVEVKFPEDGIINKNDPQLDKALEILKTEIK